MPVHLRPTQVVGSSDLQYKLGFLWPPLLKQCWLSPIVKEGMGSYRKEICLNQKDVEPGGQLSYSHICSLFRFSSRCLRTLFQYSIGKGKEALANLHPMQDTLSQYGMNPYLFLE